MSEWQKIETAPKDGSTVLVYPATWARMTASPAVWDTNSYTKKPNPYWRRLDTNSVTQSRDNIPTHWMPLPEPPHDGDSNFAANEAHIAAFDPPTVLALIDELEKARADLKSADETIFKLNSGAELQALMRINNTLVAERDAAHALLRECDSELPDTRPARLLRARIAKELKDDL